MKNTQPDIKSSPLSADIDTLKHLVLAQQAELENKDSELEKKDHSLEKKQGRIQHLEETLLLLRHRLFGKSSEKNTEHCDDQIELFDEVEVSADEAAATLVEACDDDSNNDDDAPAPKPKKSRGRKPLPKELPRVVIEHDLTDAEKVCACGCQKALIGVDQSEQLDIIPAKIQVLVHTRNKYACKHCESAPQLAPLPPQPIPKSNASPGLLAHIAVSKYQDGLPLYRLETIFKRLDIHLPRSTQATWMIKCTGVLQPLYNLLNDHLLSSGYVHMDETPLQVLKEEGKSAASKSYMWVRKTGDPGGGQIRTPIVLFDYDPTRKASVVASLLADFQGYLQTDDYVGYHAHASQDGITQLRLHGPCASKIYRSAKSSAE